MRASLPMTFTALIALSYPMAHGQEPGGVTLAASNTGNGNGNGNIGSNNGNGNTGNNNGNRNVGNDNGNGNAGNGHGNGNVGNGSGNGGSTAASGDTLAHSFSFRSLTGGFPRQGGWWSRH